jgi:hypothetical protein
VKREMKRRERDMKGFIVADLVVIENGWKWREKSQTEWRPGIF